MSWGRTGTMTAIVIALAAAFLATSPPTMAQTSASDDNGQQPIGIMHDKQRRAKARLKETLDEGVNEFSVRYARMKKEIEDSTGITYTMEMSLSAQWGTPRGGYGAWQAIFQPTVNWNAFGNDTIGAGSFQFHYLNAQWFSGQTAQSLGTALGINTPLNDWPTDSAFFQQVSYTHAFPGNWLAVTVGQFAFSNFDNNTYANDPQLGFMSLALSQNASETYSQGSLGGYVQINPTPEVTLAAGFQDATNVFGTSINFNTFGSGRYAWFVYGGWQPTVPGWGQGSYSLLYFSQPAVPVQPVASDGLSFNAAQPIGDKWGLFVRANTTWGGNFPVQTSVGGGVVLNDPLDRDKYDQIGLGFAWNGTNRSVYAPIGQYAASGESMLELYWAWDVLDRLVITPDIQLYFGPALNPVRTTAAVFGLRVTRLF